VLHVDIASAAAANAMCNILFTVRLP